MAKERRLPGYNHGGEREGGKAVRCLEIFLTSIDVFQNLNPYVNLEK